MLKHTNIIPSKYIPIQIIMKPAPINKSPTIPKMPSIIFNIIMNIGIFLGLGSMRGLSNYIYSFGNYSSIGLSSSNSIFCSESLKFCVRRKDGGR